MPFVRPNLAALRAQAAADLAAALPGTDPLLPVSNLGVLADVEAEGFNGAYGYLDYIARQAVPFTAVDEAFEGWAALKGVIRKPATKATGQATWTGATPGVLLEAGSPVSRRDGVTYVTTADASVNGFGVLTAGLEASVVGSGGTIVDGVAIVLGQAVAGIGGTGTAAPKTPGVDVEEFGDFRTRTLAIYRKPPQGGSIADYPEWAVEVPGVTRAWCKPNGKGPGTVIVYFMMDIAQAAFGGFPQGGGGVATLETRDAAATGDMLTVADHIYVKQPVTALVYALPPLRNTVTFTISLPGASAALKASILAVIDVGFELLGEPGGTVNNSDIESAISALSGSAGFVITAEACTHGAVTPGPAGNIVSAPGYLPVRGFVTWA